MKGVMYWQGSQQVKQSSHETCKEVITYRLSRSLVIPPKAHLEKVLGKSLHKRTHSCSHRSLRRHFCVCTRVDNLFPTTQVYIIVYTKTHINKHIHMHNHSLQVPLIRGPYHTFQTLILTWVEEGGTRVKLEVCAHYQRLYVIQ